MTKDGPRTAKAALPAAQKTANGEPGARVRGSGAKTVYDRLRQSILDLSLEPGSPLDEVTLSAQFNMSRTPIREALVRLVAEGLVTTLPNRNTVVTTIDFAHLPVYFEALRLMYRVTTRAAAVRHTDDALVSIRIHEAAYADAVTRMDALGMIQANRDFHVAIAEAGGNSYFTSLFARLLDEGRRILRIYYQSFDDRLPRQYVEDHNAMVTAIANGEADLCDELATVHADQIIRQIQSYIAQNAIGDISLKH